MKPCLTYWQTKNLAASFQHILTKYIQYISTAIFTHCYYRARTASAFTCTLPPSPENGEQIYLSPKATYRDCFAWSSLRNSNKVPSTECCWPALKNINKGLEYPPPSFLVREKKISDHSELKQGRQQWQHQKTMIWLVEWAKIIVLHVRHALQYNSLT